LELKQALAAQARQGFAAADLMKQETLLALAPALHVQGSDRAEMATLLVDQLADALRRLPVPTANAARALLGTDHSTEALRLGDRREAAARLLGVEPATFRRHREPELFEDIARALLLTAADRRRPSRKTGSEQPREGFVDPRRVLVVAGRNERALSSVFDYLRALGLRPIEWRDAVSETGVASPSITDVLSLMVERAQAVLVVLTPDEAGRSRQNVIFEAGLFMGLVPNRTVLLEFGRVEKPSDLSGLQIIAMNDSAAARSALRSRLISVGCAVDVEADEWLVRGEFADAGEPAVSAADTGRVDGLSDLRKTLPQTNVNVW